MVRVSPARSWARLTNVQSVAAAEMCRMLAVQDRCGPHGTQQPGGRVMRAALCTGEHAAAQESAVVGTQLQLRTRCCRATLELRQPV